MRKQRLFLLFYPKHLGAQHNRNSHNLVVLSDLLGRSRFYSFNIHTKYRESYDKPIFTKGEFQDVDLRTAELRFAPDSIKLCNRQLGDDYTYYMSPNTNVTRICNWAAANLNPWTGFFSIHLSRH
jgi:hypothetical protein